MKRKPGHHDRPRHEPKKVRLPMERLSRQERAKIRKHAAAGQAAGAYPRDLSRWMQIHGHWVERAKYTPFLAAALDAIRELRNRPPEALTQMFHGVVRDPKRKITSFGLKWWQRQIEGEIIGLLQSNHALPSADALAERVVYTQLLKPEFYSKDKHGN